MWLGTCKMGSFQCFPVSRHSSVSKLMIQGLGFILLVTVGSFSLGYIYYTSMILIVFSIFFTLLFSQKPKQLIPNQDEEDGCSVATVECEYLEEFTERIAEQVAKKEEGTGGMHRALNFLATVSEEESPGEDDDDHCMTTSEDDENVRDNYVARSSLTSEDDGSISDEDTLIELELPAGYYLSPKQYEHNSKQKPLWMEPLSEANSELATEEDNLIEIDISIGSIMCPRLEIEA